MITYNFIYYIGLFAVIFGLVFFGVFLNKFVRAKEVKSIKEISKMTYLKFGGTFALTLLGFILLNVAYFIEPATIEFLAAKELSVSILHYFLIYWMGIIFVINFFTFVTSFILMMYYKEFGEVFNKRIKIIFIVSAILIAFTFIGYTEGLAPYLQYPLANSLYIGLEGIRFINSYETHLDNGLSIAFYGIFIVSGAVLVLYISECLLFRKFGKYNLMTSCFFIAFPSGLVGARLWYVVLDLTKNGASSIFFKDFFQIFRVWNGGMGIMGGAILGIIGGVSFMLVMKYIKKKELYQGVNYFKLIDIVVPTILIAQAIGRWGNFFNNEVYGEAVRMEYFLWLPTFIRSNMIFASHGGAALTNELMYLPLFFIEFISNIAGYFIIRYLLGKLITDKYAPGSQAGFYLMWYGATRAVLEPLRTGADYFGASVYSSYIMIGGGALYVIIMFILRYKGVSLDKEIKKEDLKTDA